MDMYERFTNRARKVMAMANQEAQRLNHEYIGSEHILLGLVREGSGVGAHVLNSFNVNLRCVRLELEKLVKPGPELGHLGKLPPTPRAKKAIENAIEESRNLKHNYVGTEHLLLGLLREADGIPAIIMMKIGLKLEAVRDEVLNRLAAGVTDEMESGSEPAASKPAVASGQGLSTFERLQSESVLQGSEIQITPGLGLALLPHNDASLFEEIIAPAMAANNIKCHPAQDIFQPAASLAKVWRQIRTAQVIVADLSGRDANVIFELGLCFGLHRCPIMLVRDPSELPFNLRSLRYIEYENDVEGIERLKRKLTAAIQEFVAHPMGDS